MAQKSVTALARRALLKRSRDLLRPKLHRKAAPDDVLASLEGTERRELEEIHAALERIERGIFGKCEACSEKIEPILLEETPWRRTCRNCAGSLQSVHDGAPVSVGITASEHPEEEAEASDQSALIDTVR